MILAILSVFLSNPSLKTNIYSTKLPVILRMRRKNANSMCWRSLRSGNWLQSVLSYLTRANRYCLILSVLLMRRYIGYKMLKILHDFILLFSNYSIYHNWTLGRFVKYMCQNHFKGGILIRKHQNFFVNDILLIYLIVFCMLPKISEGMGSFRYIFFTCKFKNNICFEKRWKWGGGRPATDATYQCVDTKM